MKRAVELFDFELLGSSSPHVSRAWRTTSEPEPEPSFLSVAVPQWEMVVTRQAGGTWMTVRGPETRATAATIPADAEFFGISFALGTFLPQLSMRRLVDGAFNLPPASETSVWFGGREWEFPRPHNADVFVDRLVRAGLLAHDPVVPAALRGDEPDGLSTRTVERRVARATGLTQGAIRQMRRADQAVELLGLGLPPLEVARQAGYADQPHMTRSLKRFVGQTPSSLSFKTPTPAQD
jgi:Helix-turn-helix domain